MAIKINRTYLLNVTKLYLQAAIENTKSYLNLADNVRATYNGEVIDVGANEIWQIAVRFGSRQTFVDTVTRSAVFFGTATNEAVMGPGKDSPKNKPGDENNLTAAAYNRSITRWWFYAVRLTVNELGELAEIEEVATPEKTIHFDVHAGDYPLRNVHFDVMVPESMRHTRKELIAIADTYWHGVDKSMAADDVLIHPDCQRFEMGTVCTNARRNYFTQNANFRLPGFTWKINSPRYYVVDTARGVVVCMAQFLQYKEDSAPSFVAAEAFQIEDGLIKTVMAFFKPMSPNGGWDNATVPQVGLEEG